MQRRIMATGLLSARCVFACLLASSLPLQAGEPGIPGAARLETADGLVIGELLGHVTASSGRGDVVGAYTVLSAQGYLADVLPSGQLASVPALVYELPDCKGAPYIEIAAKSGDPAVVPGQVFRVALEPAAYIVPPGAGARSLRTGSSLRRTEQGTRCLDESRIAEVYPLAVNEERLTGLRGTYAVPLRIANPPPAADPSRRRPADSAQNEFAAAPFDVPPDTPQCAPGCFMPYLGDGVCEKECASSLCGFDRGDCREDVVGRARQKEAALCAPACQPGDLGDGFCDERCNVPSCAFDQGDCAKPH